jgi:hypothetical protein
VNRAEKPKPPVKPAALEDLFDNSTLAPSSMRAALQEGPSPFSTPPSSNASPTRDEFAPPLPPGRPNLSQVSVNLGEVNGFFEPPVHPETANRRRDYESNTQGHIQSNLITDLRSPKPTLPIRPTVVATDQQRLDQNLKPGNGKVQTSRGPQISSRSSAIITSATPLEDSAVFATPPKRNLSNPTQQSQIPARTHGRSMTVDRTSSRATQEFRSTAPTVVSRTEVKHFSDATSGSALNPEEPYISTDYPDSTRSNRRPPFFKRGVHEVVTKYDTRCFDVCGELVCTTGHFTRVWSLLDGELLMSLTHGETTKILSMVFKPAGNVDEEGARLWLGTNFGEIQEVDILAQNVVASRPGAHTRREITKMYRHGDEIWSLDDSGTLHLWASDESGSPSLSANPTQSFRLPKGHTFSMVVGHQLWHATGRDIRIFVPTPDGRTQFQVLQRPLSQKGVGEVSSGTVMSNNPDAVFFGHNDGKVTIYSRKDFSCLGIINVSIYKINTLTGVGDYLWAAYNTGMIYVYDTRTTPWTVKKDWRAHDNPVVGVIADRSSFWKLDRMQVVSLGADNVLRPWDGMLQEDWLGEYTFSDDYTVQLLTSTRKRNASPRS